MKLSYNWLKDYLEMDLTPAQVAEAMTSIGIEVDSLEEQEEIPGGLAGVVVAKVVECIPHPDSDHLHLTKVDAGTGELLQVVCGAPNVAAGCVTLRKPTTSSKLFHSPRAKPFMMTAPRAEASSTSVQTTGVSSMSAWNCIRNWFFVGPPSAQISLRRPPVARAMTLMRSLIW